METTTASAESVQRCAEWCSEAIKNKMTKPFVLTTLSNMFMLLSGSNINFKTGVKFLSKNGLLTACDAFCDATIPWNASAPESETTWATKLGQRVRRTVIDGPSNDDIGLASAFHVLRLAQNKKLKNSDAITGPLTASDRVNECSYFAHALTCFWRKEENFLPFFSIFHPVFLGESVEDPGDLALAESYIRRVAATHIA